MKFCNDFYVRCESSSEQCVHLCFCKSYKCPDKGKIKLFHFLKNHTKSVFLGWLLVNFCFLLIWYLAYYGITQNTTQDVQDQLENMQQSMKTSLDTWQSKHYHTVKYWAKTSHVRNLTQGLLKTKRSPDALISAPEQTRLRNILKPVLAEYNYQGYFVISTDGLSLASSRDANTGSLNLIYQKSPQNFQQLLQRKQNISPPQLSDIALDNSVFSAQDFTMFVAYPIGPEENPIALLTLRIQPDEFFALFKDLSNESQRFYAFDQEGRLMSPVSTTEQKLFAPLRTSTQAWLWPVQQSRLQGQKQNLKGYTSFDGQTSVGQWLYNPTLNLTLVSETVSAYAYYSKERMLFGLHISFSVFLIALNLIMYLLFKDFKHRALQSQQNLDKQKERAQTYLDASASLIVILKNHDQIHQVNQWALQRLAYVSLKHQAFLSLVLESEREQFSLLLKQAATMASSDIIENQIFHIYDAQAEAIPFQFNLSVLPDSHEMVLIGQDISELLKTQNQLKDEYHARRMAEEANEAKSRFLANMSHEIRTPLQAMLGLTEMLFKSDLDRQQHDFTKKLKRVVENLRRITNNILDFSKIEAGMLEIESINFEIEEILKNLASIFSHKAKNRNIQFHFNIDPETYQTYRGDALRLAQILNNLCSNALKFTQNGEVELKIERTQSTNDKDTLYFEIRDTGIGFSAEQQAILLEAFTQADNSISRQFGGTGLGLSIVDKLLQLMGSQLHMESKQGEGSRFFFTLEFEQVLDTKPQVSLPQFSEHALILAQNDLTQNILARSLQYLGLQTTQIQTCADAEILFTESDPTPHFDLIFIDYESYLQNNWKTLSELEPLQKMADRIILLSQSLNLEFRPGQSQQEYIVQKPLTLSALVKGINTILRPHEVSASDKAILPAKTFKDLRVLLVEDNEINQEINGFLLKEEGAMISLAHHGQEALDILFAHPVDYFDLVLMDLQMPIMDGIQAAKQIREKAEFQALQIWAITADAIPEVKEEALKAGMNRFLTKPFQIDELKKHFAEWFIPHEKTQNPQSTAPATDLDFEKLKAFKSLEIDNHIIWKNHGSELGLSVLKMVHDKHKDFFANFSIDNGPETELRAKLHNIKGSVGSIGLVQLSDTASGLSQAIREKAGPAQREAAAQKLKAAWDVFDAEFSQFMFETAS